MLINLKSLSPVLVMISSMSLPIYNRFHLLGGEAVFDARLRRPP